MRKYAPGFSILAIVVLSALAANGAPPVRFASQGDRIRGPQMAADAGFDFLDWNGDGNLDVYLPSGSMNTSLFAINRGSRTQPSFSFAIWYPLNITETEPYGLYFTQAQVVCDLNHDGLWDMIYYDGQMRMSYNTGTKYGPNHWKLATGKDTVSYFPGSAKMQRENSRVTVVPESMFWGKGVFPRQVLTMTVADWDGDGLEDLIICRFKDEAPGVSAGARVSTTLPSQHLEKSTAGEKLAAAPERGLCFYKNVGTKEKPYFDAGIEITTPDGKSIAAPNPIVVDFDGDGAMDIVSTEAPYSCNSFRVDWPTAPTVTVFRRPSKSDGSHLEPAAAINDSSGKPIAAGVCARMVDYRGVGVMDLFVQDPATGIRWYLNSAKDAHAKPVFAAPTVLQGEDFARTGGQPLVVDWFAPHSRDLIIHGVCDGHCQWGLRRTALYRNVGKKPGEMKYEFVGNLDFQGDPAMVPQQAPYEDRPYDVFGSCIGTYPDDASGKHRLVMSVGGKLYLFSQPTGDGLSFQDRAELNLPQVERNECRGWQEIEIKPQDKPQDKVQFVRIQARGQMNMVAFEAISDGKNVATLDQGAQVKLGNGQAPSGNWKGVLTTGNQPSNEKANFISYQGPAIFSLKEPTAIEKIRFLLSDREASWYGSSWHFSWQGKQVRRYIAEPGECFYNYQVEVSSDGKTWTKVCDRMNAEMMRSFPVFVDWNHDGNVDLVLGVANSDGLPTTGIAPTVAIREREYRVYLNKGTNDAPKFDEYLPVCDENGKKLTIAARSGWWTQSGVTLVDRNGDGKLLDLVIEEAGRGSGLCYYENLSSPADKQVRVKFVKKLGDPIPIELVGDARYFQYVDADGDGIPDLVTLGLVPWFFKGVAAGAPAEVNDLAVIGNASDGIEVQWTRPAGAAKYDLRAVGADRFMEIDWPSGATLSGEYSAAEGKVQTAKISLPPGATMGTVVVKSSNAKGEFSGLSNCATAVASPLKQVVLRNGPEAAQMPAYQGSEGCYVDANQPEVLMPRQPSKLEARADLRSKFVLIRFKDLPKLGTLEQATLELTADAQLENKGKYVSFAQADVSCAVISDDWDAAAATFTKAAPGKPWPAGELVGGGTTLSQDRIVDKTAPVVVLRWNVTKAVAEANKAGKTSISLIVRAEFNGNYSHQEGYVFCGPQWPDPQLRPRLRLITK